MSPPGEEIEPKPGAVVGPGEPRPLSWGEREQRRRDRRRAKQPGVMSGWLGRLARRLGKLSRTLGLTRRKIDAQGVVYRERSGVSLRRALGPTGSGVKEYDVRFPAPGAGMRGSQYPARESMRIRYTHARMYADLGHDPRVRVVQMMHKRVRPGDRVLELGCGTGGSSSVLAALAGPSGGVVAITRDGESIRFARQRYRCDHLAFELGWLETLEGELDGAFDAVFAVDLFRDAPDDPGRSRAVSSVWRVLREGGLMVVSCSDRNRLDDVVSRLGALGAGSVLTPDPDPVLLWGTVAAVKPEPGGAGGVDSSAGRGSAS